MNKVELMGRLVADPTVKTTQSQKAVCNFTIAVERKFKTASGERQSDFLNIVAWGQSAELIGKYFQKGSRIIVIGNLQSRSYDNADGKKTYTTEVVLEELYFVDKKGEAVQSEPANEGSRSTPATPTVAESFYPAMDDDTTLPFDL